MQIIQRIKCLFTGARKSGLCIYEIKQPNRARRSLDEAKVGTTFRQTLNMVRSRRIKNEKLHSIRSQPRAQTICERHPVEPRGIIKVPLESSDCNKNYLNPGRFVAILGRMDLRLSSARLSGTLP